MKKFKVVPIQVCKALAPEAPALISAPTVELCPAHSQGCCQSWRPCRRVDAETKFKIRISGLIPTAEINLPTHATYSGDIIVDLPQILLSHCSLIAVINEADADVPVIHKLFHYRSVILTVIRAEDYVLQCRLLLQRFGCNNNKLWVGCKSKNLLISEKCESYLWPHVSSQLPSIPARCCSRPKPQLLTSEESSSNWCKFEPHSSSLLTMVCFAGSIWMEEGSVYHGR